MQEVANGILVSFERRQQEVTGEVMRLLKVCDGEKNRSELQQALGLEHKEHFKIAYLLPALEQGVLEMTRSPTPKSRLQHHRRILKGNQLI